MMRGSIRCVARSNIYYACSKVTFSTHNQQHNQQNQENDESNKERTWYDDPDTFRQYISQMKITDYHGLAKQIPVSESRGFHFRYFVHQLNNPQQSCILLEQAKARGYSVVPKVFAEILALEWNKYSKCLSPTTVIMEHDLYDKTDSDTSNEEYHVEEVTNNERLSEEQRRLGQEVMQNVRLVLQYMSKFKIELNRNLFVALGKFGNIDDRFQAENLINVCEEFKMVMNPKIRNVHLGVLFDLKKDDQAKKLYSLLKSENMLNARGFHRALTWEMENENLPGIKMLYEDSISNPDLLHDATLKQLFQYFVAHNCLLDAREIFDRMMESSVEFRHTTIYSLLHLYIKVGGVPAGRDFLREIEANPSRNHLLNVQQFNILLTEFANQGDVTGLARTFDEMERAKIAPNLQSLHCVLRAYATLGDHQKVLSVFKEQLLTNFEPDQHAYAIFFESCGHLRDLESLQHHMMLARLKRYVTRRSFFAYMMGLARCGAWNLVSIELNNMERLGFAPDKILFTFLLEACLHASNFALFDKIAALATSSFTPDGRLAFVLAKRHQFQHQYSRSESFVYQQR